MKLSTQSVLNTVMLILLAVCLLQTAPARAQDDPVVQSASPSSAIQGTYDLPVEILGANFARGASVRFLVNCEGLADPLPPYCNQDAPGVSVGKAKVRGSTRLIVEVDVSEEAYVGEVDIQVELLNGRKGKGTTLFHVISRDSSQPNDCMFDFEAVFRDAPGDGVSSDEGGSYVAGGGKGMRLDTNGSQKLERKNDTRFVQIDFYANGECDLENPQNPGGATGFCNLPKGVDMRIEHQEQEPQGLCSIDPGYDMQQTVRIAFQGGPNPLLEELDLNGKGGSTEPDSFIINYGCQGPRIDPDIWADHADDRVWITRFDDHTWIFEGEWACVTSQLGNIMVDNDLNPIRVNMPFALCIEDIDGPANVCDTYFVE